MANVKRIVVTGTLPFNIHELAPSTFAFLAGPTTGLQITYSPDKMVPNHLLPENGGGHPEGKTMFYKFRLQGEEAVSWVWLDAFYTLVTSHGGTITDKRVTEL